jgi:hypothetical protein
VVSGPLAYPDAMTEQWWIDERLPDGTVTSTHGPYPGTLEAGHGHRGTGCAATGRDRPDGPVVLLARGCICAVRGPRGQVIGRQLTPA